MKRMLKSAAFLAFVAAIVLWATGAFRGRRVAPGRTGELPGAAEPRERGTAEAVTVPLHEDAVGTVRSRTEVLVSAQVTARILSVEAEAGAAVDEGAILIRLDDRELSVRVAQAKEALAAAQAAREAALQAKSSAEAVLAQAKARHDRVRLFLEQKAATPEQMEQAESGYLQAQAGVSASVAQIAAADASIEQARQGVEQAEIALGHATIRAPIAGLVKERAAEPGDLASVGRPLLQLLDPKALRLEAQVREGLLGLLPREGTLTLSFPALGRSVEGRLAEVIPAADPASRTFRVRVDFDPFPGIHTGMFGRLRIPIGTRETVAAPARAVERVGQLETALVLGAAGYERRLVRTGAVLADGRVEVLSGLRGGETLGLFGEKP